MSDADAASEGFVKAVDTDRVLPGEVVTAEVNGRDVAIVNLDGEYYAVDGLCPHQEGPLGEGFVQGGCLVCPWHHWEFDVKTGEYLDDPMTTVKRYETKVENGAVLVKVDG